MNEWGKHPSLPGSTALCGARMASDDPSGREEAFQPAYPRVGDALTLTLWREPALHVARWTARAGVGADALRMAAALLAVLTFVLFWNAAYWWGLLGGFAFGLVELVGSIPRTKGSRPKWVGLLTIVPPFCWWAWEHGLAAYGRPLEPVTAIMVLGAIVGGYCAERAIEWLFARRSHGTPIDQWTRLDSRFRLVAAGTNVNLLILAAALLFARPDAGLVVAAGWTIASGIFHAVRLAQLSEQMARGQAVASWLDA
jgi:hypothetical protein